MANILNLQNLYKKFVKKSGVKPAKLTTEGFIRADWTKNQKGGKMIQDIGATSWTYKGTDIMSNPESLECKYQNYRNYTIEDRKVPMSKERYKTWILAHEHGHVEEYRKKKQVYPADKKTKHGCITGTYIGERDASRFASKHVRGSKDVFMNTLSSYARTDAEYEDVKKQSRIITHTSRPSKRRTRRARNVMKRFHEK